MLHSYDIENCEVMSATMVEKGEIYKKGRTYCLARVLNDVSYKSNKYILGISILPTLLSKECSCVLIVEIKEILPFNVISLMLHTSFEDACYKHIPLVKSGKDNQFTSQWKIIVPCDTADSWHLQNEWETVDFILIFF